MVPAECEAIDIYLIPRWSRSNGITSKKVVMRWGSSTGVDPPNAGLG